MVLPFSTDLQLNMHNANGGVWTTFDIIENLQLVIGGIDIYVQYMLGSFRMHLIIFFWLCQLHHPTCCSLISLVPSHMPKPLYSRSHFTRQYFHEINDVSFSSLALKYSDSKNPSNVWYFRCISLITQRIKLQKYQQYLWICSIISRFLKYNSIT
jgi:hypothetical protein